MPKWITLFNDSSSSQIREYANLDELTLATCFSLFGWKPLTPRTHLKPKRKSCKSRRSIFPCKLKHEHGFTVSPSDFHFQQFFENHNGEKSDTSSSGLKAHGRACGYIEKLRKKKNVWIVEKRSDIIAEWSPEPLRASAREAWQYTWRTHEASELV